MHNVRVSAAWVGVVFVFVALLLSFFFVWPGVWRYEYFIFQNTNRLGSMGERSYGPMCYRVDRITGKVHYLDVEGWH